MFFVCVVTLCSLSLLCIAHAFHSQTPAVAAASQRQSAPELPVKQSRRGRQMNPVVPPVVGTRTPPTSGAGGSFDRLVGQSFSGSGSGPRYAPQRRPHTVSIFFCCSMFYRSSVYGCAFLHGFFFDFSRFFNGQSCINHVKCKIILL